MSSSLYVNVDALAGSHAAVVCHEMVALAERLGVGIDCKFNGVKIIAHPGDNAELLWRSLVYQLSAKGPEPKFATVGDTLRRERSATVSA